MEAFRTHTGIGVPLRRSNVDTDQIIPAVFLKRVTRTGFEDGLFADWRSDPSFILNLSPFDRGSVLVAGPDFGTGPHVIIWQWLIVETELLYIDPPNHLPLIGVGQINEENGVKAFRACELRRQLRNVVRGRNDKHIALMVAEPREKVTEEPSRDAGVRRPAATYSR